MLFLFFLLSLSFINDHIIYHNKFAMPLDNIIPVTDKAALGNIKHRRTVLLLLWMTLLQ